MKTLLLDVSAWDLVIALDGNIAVASDPYAQAQDAASAIKLFKTELYYDTTKGVPYDTILGKLPTLPNVKARMVAAAMTVPGVVAAACFISSLLGRRLSGQVQIRTTAGTTAAATF